MPGPNEVIHQSTRLKIMAALKALPRSEQLEFARLKKITGATDGNLGAHIATLENASYIKVVKDFVGKKPRTRIGLTAAGRKAFQDHADYLRDILAGDDAV